MGKLTTQSELEQIRSALDSTTILAITDKKGVITYANDLFVKISGYDKEELIGQTHSMVNSDYHDREFWLELWKKIASGQTWNGIIRNQKKNGEHYWVETSIVPILDDEEKPDQYVAIRKDITDRMLAESELEIHRAKSMYSEKMAALGEMAAGIAHELGNPMGAIRGRIEMLSMLSDKGPVSDDQIKEFCKRSTGIIDKMSLIIKGLQAYSRDASKDPFSKSDITLLINEVLEFSSTKLRRHDVTLKKVGLDTPVFAACREAEIGQVILNLVSNACDAVQKLDPRVIEVRLSTNATHAQVRVIDTGPGIPKNILENIFNPFFTTKEVGKGTGLGLSISKKIAISHNGRLDLDPSFEKTCFLLEIPLTQESNASSSVEA